MFTKSNLPQMDDFRWFRKRLHTRATRIYGAFKTQTLEGELECKDGYLVLDADGNPYPVDKEIFEKTYETVNSIEALAPKVSERS